MTVVISVRELQELLNVLQGQKNFISLLQEEFPCSDKPILSPFYLSYHRKQINKALSNFENSYLVSTPGFQSDSYDQLTLKSGFELRPDGSVKELATHE